MSFLPDELKIQTFPCPNCKQYISSEVDVCKFCSTPIPNEIKQSAIDKENKEKKATFLKGHKNTIILGLGILAAGILFLFDIFIAFKLSYADNTQSINCLAPIFIIIGIGIIIVGLNKYLKEIKND